MGVRLAAPSKTGIPILQWSVRCSGRSSIILKSVVQRTVTPHVQSPIQHRTIHNGDMQLAYAALKAKEEQLLEDRRVLTHKTRPSIQRRLREAYSRQATPKRRESNGPYSGVQHDRLHI